MQVELLKFISVYFSLVNNEVTGGVLHVKILLIMPSLLCYGYYYYTRVKENYFEYAEASLC